MAVIGQAEILLTANTTSFTAEMDRARSVSQRTARQIEQDQQQQANARLQIERQYANEHRRIEMDLADEIQRIRRAGFNTADQDRYLAAARANAQAQVNAIAEQERATNSYASKAKTAYGLVATAVVGAATAIGVLVKDQMELVKGISEVAAKANTSAVAIQKYTIAAKASGIEMDKMGDIFKDTQDKIGDLLNTGGGELEDFMKNVGEKAGLTAEKLRHLSGPDALQAMYDAMEKANISQSEMINYMESIADDASTLIPLLQNGGAGFQLWADAAENAGAVMDAKTIRATQELNTSTQLLNLSYQGVKNQIAQAFLPVLSDLAAYLVRDTNAKNMAASAGKAMAEGFKYIISTGLGVVGIFRLLGSGAGALAAAIFHPLDAINIMSAAWEDMKGIVGGVNKAMDAVFSAGASGQTNATVVKLTDLTNATEKYKAKLGKTGAEIQADTKKKEENAKASEKAAKANRKLAEKTVNSTVLAHAQKYGYNDIEKARNLPKGLLAAISMTESGGNPNATSHTGAKGEFQLMPATAARFGAAGLERNTAKAAVAAAKYLEYLLNKFGDLDKAIMAYNAGEGNMASGKAYQFKETREYLTRVKGRMASLDSKGVSVSAEKGQLVGITGNTGIGTGAHLHIQIADGSRRLTDDELSRFKADDKSLLNWRISSEYGARKAPTKGASTFHKGVDFATPDGTPITTTVPVKSVEPYNSNGKGGYVSLVTFADGLQVKMLHQNKNVMGVDRGGSSGNKELDSAAKNAEKIQADNEKLAGDLKQQYLETFKEQTINWAKAEYDKINQARTAGTINAEQWQAMSDEVQRIGQLKIDKYNNEMSKQVADVNKFATSQIDKIKLEQTDKKMGYILDDKWSKAENSEKLKEILDAIDKETEYRLQQLALTEAKEKQSQESKNQTIVENIQAEAKLQRRELALDVKMSADLRQVKLQAINDSEQEALRQARQEFETELSGINEYAKTEVQKLRDEFMQQRTALDARTDISDSQKSDLRNALAGKFNHDLAIIRKPAADDFNNLNAEMSNTGEWLTLQNQLNQRLEIIKKAKDAEVIATDQAEQAKLAIQRDYMQASSQLITTQGENIAGSMTTMVKTVAGENSKAYRAMFAIEKGLAIARSVMAIQTGIAQAAANPFPFNLAAMASVAAATANIITTLQSVRQPAIQGQAHDGIDNIPREGTWLLDGGERIVKPSDNRKLSDFLDNPEKRMGKNPVNVNIINNAGVPVQQSQDNNGDIRVIIGEEIAKQLPQHVNDDYSEFNQHLKRKYHIQRRL